MLIKRQKKNLNILILAIILCTIVLGNLFFIKIKSDDIKNYQHHDKYSKGYSESIKDMLRNEKHNPLNDNSYERLASLYNLAGLAYFNKAKLFFKEENYKKAEAAFGYSLDSLKHCKGCDKYDLFESIVYNNLALTYYDYAHFTKSAKLKQDLYPQAIKNFDKVLDKRINKKIDDYPFEEIQCYLLTADSYKNLGILYAQDGKITLATRNFETAKQKIKNICKIMHNKKNEAGIMASSQIWCKTKSVINYFGFAEIPYRDYKHLQTAINNISKSIMEEISDKQSIMTGKIDAASSKASSSSGCPVK